MDALAKSPKGLPLIDFKEKLRKPVQKILVAGYSYNDISQLLKERNIYIPAATIQRHLEGKEPGGNQKSDRSVKKFVKNTVDSPESPASVEVSESSMKNKAELEKIKADQVKEFNFKSNKGSRKLEQ